MKEIVVVILFVVQLYAAPGLKRQGEHYIEPTLMELANKAMRVKSLPEVPKDAKSIKGEMKALMEAIRKYNLEAPAHQTDGWSDFVEAEWPFMAMAYTGFSLCRLPELVPELKDKCRTEVEWILGALKRPAMTGFVKAHFGEPFPKDQLPQRASVFVHGHYLYLAMLAKKYLQVDMFDETSHKIYKAFLRDYKQQALLPSYRSMYYVPDNGSALAAMKLYDDNFGLRTSVPVRSMAVKALKAFCLDPKSQLISTYINFNYRKRDSGPRGTAVMYLGIFLPEIDVEFSKHQWNQAKRTLITPLNQVTKQATLLPIWASHNISNLLPSSMICMEHPNTMNWLDRQYGDLDSGPVVLGVGTSASGFMIGAAAKADDMDTAKSVLKLAQFMADYKWIKDQYVATNAFHETGQAVIFYGKVLAFLKMSGSF